MICWHSRILYGGRGEERGGGGGGGGVQAAVETEVLVLVLGIIFNYWGCWRATALGVCSLAV